MAKDKIPATPALRELKKNKVDFSPRLYDYTPKSGAMGAAVELGVDGHRVVKTLVMQDEARRPFLVLMHGDREVSTKTLARTMKVKSVAPCDPDTAFRLTGYKVGGISPFGVRRPMPVYAQSTIFDLDRIWINGGKRGLLVEMAPPDLDRVLHPTKVSVAV